MTTKMTVLVTIAGKINSRELYDRIGDVAHVTDLGDKTLVYSRIDIRDDTVERVINTCKEYGECKVEADREKE